jgi:ATP-dependent Lon protease
MTKQSSTQCSNDADVNTIMTASAVKKELNKMKRAETAETAAKKLMGSVESAPVLEANQYEKFLASLLSSSETDAIKMAKNVVAGGGKGGDKKRKNKKQAVDENDEAVNITFNIVVDGEEEYEEEIDEYASESEEEESEDEETEDDATEDDSETDATEDESETDESSSDEEFIPKKKNFVAKNTRSNSVDAPPKEGKEASESKVDHDQAIVDSLKKLLDGMGGDLDHPIAKELVKLKQTAETNIKRRHSKLDKKIKGENTLQYKRSMRATDQSNDVKYFKENLTVAEQANIIEQANIVKKLSRTEMPYALKVLSSDIPATFKVAAMSKLSTLKSCEPGSGEYAKIKDWLDTFMQIPFGKYSRLPVTMDDGVDRCHEFMASAKATLDKAVYGMDDAKLQIMQLMGQWIANPESTGNAIAIGGPMGTGKTTLVIEGLAKILNRPAVLIPLGGAEDGSKLKGHGYTYEGSKPGKIVEALIQSGCSNPIFYFDELDKVSDTAKGEEIIGILTHLIDTSQNSKFHDDYYLEVSFDLSKCLFVFSWNDIEKVNPILRDRMHRIQTKGYDTAEKTIIANNYLIPSIRNQIRFSDGDITIPEETIHHIIDTMCDKEKGVRNMKRCLEIIHTKLNLYRLMKPDVNLFGKEMDIKVTFPMTITKEVIDQLVKVTETPGSKPPMGMYC